MALDSVWELRDKIAHVSDLSWYDEVNTRICELMDGSQNSWEYKELQSELIDTVYHKWIGGPALYNK